MTKRTEQEQAWLDVFDGKEPPPKVVIPTPKMVEEYDERVRLEVLDPNYIDPTKWGGGLHISTTQVSRPTHMRGRGKKRP